MENSRKMWGATLLCRTGRQLVITCAPSAPSCEAWWMLPCNPRVALFLRPQEL